MRRRRQGGRGARWTAAGPRTLAVLVLLLAAGCGRFGRAPEQADAPLAAVAPAPADDPTVEPATPAPPPATAPVPAASPTSLVTPPAAPEPARPANLAVAERDGLEVEVVADHGPTYDSHPRFRIQVTLRNHSDRTRHYFLGQGNFAALTDEDGTVVWTSGDCNPTLDNYEISGGAAPLDPGEEVRALVDYPQPDIPNDAGCDLPDGRYQLYGLFPVCPSDQVKETANPGTYSCPEESVELYASAPLSVTFGPA